MLIIYFSGDELLHFGVRSRLIGTMVPNYLVVWWICQRVVNGFLMSLSLLQRLFSFFASPHHVLHNDYIPPCG